MIDASYSLIYTSDHVIVKHQSHLDDCNRASKMQYPLDAVLNMEARQQGIMSKRERERQAMLIFMLPSQTKAKFRDIHFSIPVQHHSKQRMSTKRSATEVEHRTERE